MGVASANFSGLTAGKGCTILGGPVRGSTGTLCIISSSSSCSTSLLHSNRWCPIGWSHETHLLRSGHLVFLLMGSCQWCLASVPACLSFSFLAASSSLLRMSLSLQSQKPSYAGLTALTTFSISSEGLFACILVPWGFIYLLFQLLSKGVLPVSVLEVVHVWMGICGGNHVSSMIRLFRFFLGQVTAVRWGSPSQEYC